jgi:hypothetical protein
MKSDNSMQINLIFLLTCVIPLRWTKALPLFDKSKSQQQRPRGVPGEQNNGRDQENKNSARTRRGPEEGTMSWR